MQQKEYLIDKEKCLGRVEFSIGEDRGLHRLVAVRLYEVRGELMREARNMEGVELREVEVRRVDVMPGESIVSAKVHSFSWEVRGL